MSLFSRLEAHVTEAIGALQKVGTLPADLALARVSVEPPRDPAHGDAATNAAMVLAKPAGMKPMDLAELLADRLRSLPEVTDVGIARPGFINMTLEMAAWQREVGAAVRAGEAYGISDLGQGRKVNVEYCSANPTGPLHVGHARGTAYGDALASLLARVGHDVTREYYVNDAGAQMEVLGRSVRHRYLELLGEPVGAMPEGHYPGDYLIPVAQEIVDKDGAKWRDVGEEVWLSFFRERAEDRMLARIKDDLAAIRVVFDVFTSEAELVRRSVLDRVLGDLEAKGLVYQGTLPPPKGKVDDDWEPRPQLLYKATEFGDDTDRPLKRSGGAWTYFAVDLANHYDKMERGFLEMIDVFGADHGGYAKRMKAGVAGMSGKRASLEVKLCQLVHLLDEGQPLKMSKRAGRIVTLRDVVDEVGADAFRFIMLTRKNDAQLEFDLARVVEQSKDNPVFYVQYAHARICSVMRNAREAGIEPGAERLAMADTTLLVDPAEIEVVRHLALYPRVVEQAARHLEPHRVAFYLYEISAAFHRLWNRGKEASELRFLRADEPALTEARLALLWAVRAVIAAGLEILGVVPVEEMR